MTLCVAIYYRYTKTFAVCADVMLDKFEKMTSEPIDVSEHLSLMTLDSILKCAYSSKTDCQLKRYVSKS